MTTGSLWRFLLVALLGGISFPMLKLTLAGVTPAQLVFGRLLLGAVVLLVLAGVRGVRLPRPGGVWGHVVVAALLGNVVPFMLLSHGERTTDAAVAGILVGSTPLLTLALAAVALPTESVTRRKVIGLLTGFCGLVVVLDPWHRPIGSLGGQLACLGAALCYALYFLHIRRYLSPLGLAPVSLIAAQLCAATVLQAPPVLVEGATPHLTGEVVAGMVILGLLCTGLGYTQLFRLIGEVGAATASAVNYLEPVFSALISTVLLGESLTWTMLAGGAVLLGGLAYAENRLRRPRWSGVAGEVP
ncbi:DMT family transporter [Actinophytocola oryzae]|uniref:Drug/metabolite transporter (DMT)-like permease n=1 Tax=Actinophytocola oryzae TaxID=502181 RepID=A0A4R7W0X4_9PSEU|nr:DMT family transporter [Actinophytocola oryzae]TDV56052.1 drug/metabolite transporter (DMT)-like permease [Actinophytocola oryzae]